MLSYAPASVFASLGIFCHALAFVSTSIPAFFGFAPEIFRFAPAFFVVGPANP